MLCILPTHTSTFNYALKLVQFPWFIVMNVWMKGLTFRNTSNSCLLYTSLHHALKVMPELKVVGIAGPGDPFASPEETIETLHRVREHYPEMLLCVATNGLSLEPYVVELARLQVSHVTLTVNAVDPSIGAGIYAWVRDGRTIYRGEAAASHLLARQKLSLIHI